MIHKILTLYWGNSIMTHITIKSHERHLFLIIQKLEYRGINFWHGKNYRSYLNPYNTKSPLLRCLCIESQTTKHPRSIKKINFRTTNFFFTITDIWPDLVCVYKIFFFFFFFEKLLKIVLLGRFLLISY